MRGRDGHRWLQRRSAWSATARLGVWRTCDQIGQLDLSRVARRGRDRPAWHTSARNATNARMEPARILAARARKKPQAAAVEPTTPVRTRRMDHPTAASAGAATRLCVAAMGERAAGRLDLAQPAGGGVTRMITLTVTVTATTAAMGSASATVEGATAASGLVMVYGFSGA
ncbi:MAG: hypothetical protein BRC31_05775 [Actinobacteria bacterium QS_5_72_10]|nr:MAG: hypothetical protein BRC31_05775 [Actinobacteria bacterium QS_5_72_10]